MININLTQMCLVKLTDAGRKELERQRTEYLKGVGQKYKYNPPKEDEFGRSRWPLWSLISKLGHMWELGYEMPFDPNIEIEENPSD